MSACVKCGACEMDRSQKCNRRSNSDLSVGLDCPFCEASGDKVDTVSQGRKTYVECENCGARGPTCEDETLSIQKQMEEAQRLWRARAI